MADNISLFDLLPDEEAEKWKPIKSNDWKWTMAEDYPKEKNGLKVFSCFACGGGSTMGYKLAGCEVIGCCEIDKQMNDIYVKNHHPKYNYLMDIRKFNEIPNEDLPSELFHLDILDGSPPCTTFSMAGQREDSWGKKKKFREGQIEQTLDDLSFVFIETVAKLRPKVVIMENVEGLLLGEAFTYVQKIYSQFKDIGYQLKHYLCKGECMGIPQTRHRVFFIAVRNDIDFRFENLDMHFNYIPITYGEIKAGQFKPLAKTSKYLAIIKNASDTDKSISDTKIRMGLKKSGHQDMYVREDEVVSTIRAATRPIDIKEQAYITPQVIINSQTFPQDFDFLSDTPSMINYVCGMSVPPLMTKRIVTRVIESGVFDIPIVTQGEAQ